MEKEKLEVMIDEFIEKFLKETAGKNLQVISHFDTDGITSAAIITQTLKKIDQKFSLKIVKSLNSKIIKSLDPERPVLFLDLASGSFEHLKNSKIKKIFIIDHHELDKNQIPQNVTIINPQLDKKQKISSSGLSYLFSKKLDEGNKEFAKLAVLGMIGDMLEREIEKLNNSILEDGEIQRVRGLMIYPSTRPLNKVLEYSSNPFVPGVTGDPMGVAELLREAGIPPENGKYKNLIDLTEEEMKNLVTSIILRDPSQKNSELIGELFLVKFFGKLEDAREISAKINACSREGHPEVALGFCLENTDSKKRAESIHAKYRQQLISGINFAKEEEKIRGKGYVILNARNKIKDTMIGTISSILASSREYEEGTVIIGMSYDGKDKIKISGRNAGRKGKNLREILSNVMNSLEGEVGGHQFAAGCVINIKDEEEFIERIKNQFEVEVIKIGKK